MQKFLGWGINQYPYVAGANLRGCVNDVIAWQNLLGAKGFSTVVLTDGMATKANIIYQLTKLVREAKAGDVLVIAGSSHGSYVADQNIDEVDRRDEIICPYDFPRAYIRDDELRAILNGLQLGVICDIFLDNCYAGTGTRLMPQKHKIPVLGGRYLEFTGKPREVAEKAVVVPTMKESLFASSGENQTSAEVSVGGVPRGLFSFYAQKSIQTNPTYTRDQHMNYIKPRVAAVVPGQNPQLECQAANAAKLPFA